MMYVFPRDHNSNFKVNHIFSQIGIYLLSNAMAMIFELSYELTKVETQKTCFITVNTDSALGPH